MNTLPSTKGLSGESKPKARSSSADVGRKKLKKRKVGPQTSKPEPDVSSSRRGSQENQDEPWVDVHAPQTQVRRLYEPKYTTYTYKRVTETFASLIQAELAVHKKKVEEVESWLRVHLDFKSNNKVCIVTYSLYISNA